MRKNIFFSCGYSPVNLSVVLLLLRLAFGLTMAKHGYSKLIGFDTMKTQFMDFMGLGMTTSLALVVFAELFCAILIAMGLLTRLATIPLLIATTVMVFSAHNGEIAGDGFAAFAYFMVFFAILILGPGKFSLDHLISNRRSAGK